MLDVLYGVLAGIMICVAACWALLLRGIARSFLQVPRLGSVRGASDGPAVSVILPARNEEGYIGKCLQSLAGQDYPRYEVIAVNDSSDDATESIISGYAAKCPRIKLVNARPKPDGWMGKNWACMEGYEKASGEILLFTDADTVLAPGTMSAAVGLLQAESLDAVTAMPHIRADDFWTRITLPMISTFLHTRFSPINVNDPKKKTGYFFGSFFAMPRAVYEAAGTHRGVRLEIIEDGALGRKVKDMGYRLRMVRADDMIQAVWARDGPTLWNALKRLMVPLYLQSARAAAGAFAAVLFLLFLPFPLALYAIALDGGIIHDVFRWGAVAASAMIFGGAIMEMGFLKIRLYNALACPLGGAVVAAGFLSGMLGARRRNSVSWRGRRYTLQHNDSSRLRI